MAMNGKYGKDKVVRTSEGFISHALTGGSGPSNEIVKKSIGRPDQTINTAFGMDNVKLAMPIESSVKDASGWAGGVDNVKHSLSGASAVNEEVGAAGAVRHVIEPNH